MDVFETRLECLRLAMKKFEGPNGIHPNADLKKIVEDAQTYAAFVMPAQTESVSGRKKGADEK